MKWLRSILQISVLIGLFLTPCFAQSSTDPPVELDKWFIDKFYPYAQFFSNSYEYSKKDLDSFRETFTRISEAGVGFVSYYVYTCFPDLRDIRFGNAIEHDNCITLTPTGPSSANGKALPLRPVKYIKVTWGDRKYLVAESSLLSFAEKAAGLDQDIAENEGEENPTDEHAGLWYNYWVSGDLEKELKGLPTFPANYRSFSRKPISTTITDVAARKLMDEYATGNSNRSSGVAVYKVTLKNKKTHGLKVGMRLHVFEDDEVYIERVNGDKAHGVVVRSLDDDRKEICSTVPCKRLVAGLRVKSRSGIMAL